MPKFMLILNDHPTDHGELAPEEMQALIERYNAWAGRLAEQGKLEGGLKLADEGGRVMTKSGDRVTTVDGPFTEAKEVVGGYFILHAADYDEAVRLSEDCPHLDSGGTIYVRQADPNVEEEDCAEAS